MSHDLRARVANAIARVRSVTINNGQPTDFDFRRTDELLAEIAKTHVLVPTPVETRLKPQIISDYGDYIVLKCACGAEIGFCPQADDEDEICTCGRVLWLRVTTECGYRDVEPKEKES